MFPAKCSRGRALDSYLFAAALALSACASTGPGAPRSLASSEISPIPAPAGVSPRRAPKPRSAAPAHRRVIVDSAAMERAVTRRLAHRPLASALERRIRNPELADRVASAVVYEAGRARISPSVLAAVLVVENSRFDTSAVSTEGAIGLMQVMPMHVGNYRCLSGDLLNVEANICHGARLLNTYVRRANSVPLGLKRYNGCVRGRNTPRCYRYPTRVLRTASRLRHDLLLAAANLEDSEATATEPLPARPAAVPSQPVLATDSTEATALANACTTLLGCLRHRWSQR